MLCPHCGKSVSDNATVCPHCGTTFARASQRAGRAPSSGSAAGAYRRTDASRSSRDNLSYQEQRTAPYAAPSRDPRTRSKRPTGAHAAGGSGTRAGGTAGAGYRPRTQVSAASSPRTAAAIAQKHANTSRHKFIAVVVGAAVVASVVYLIWGSFFRPYLISSRDFPDEGVVAALSAYDADGDGKLSRDEAKAVTSLAITSGGTVSDLSKFPNLTTLTVATDDAGTVDVSSAPNLQTLDLSGAPNVSAVTLSNNAKLTSIDVEGTQVSALDVAQAPNLQTLDVLNTPLTSLDVSSNTQMVKLDCADGVAVSGVGNTRMQTYWVVSGMQSSIPLYGSTAGENAAATATYDSDNRLASITYQSTESAASGSSNGTTTIAFTYDDAGNVVQTTATGDTITGAGSTSALSWTVAYDDAGRPTTAVSLSGQTYAYTYDAQGRVATLTTSGTGVVAATYTYAYDDQGHVTSCTASTGLRTEYTYDSAGRLTAAKAAPTGTDENATSFSYTFAYDDAGRVTASTYAETTGQTANTLSEKYAYNKLGQLTDASRETTGTNTSWTYAHHALAAADYTYDDAGNLTDIKLKRENTDDGTYEECALTYHRVLASADYAPTGTLRPTTYPLDASAADCVVAEMPWRTLPAPYTMVFAPATSTVTAQAN